MQVTSSSVHARYLLCAFFYSDETLRCGCVADNYDWCIVPDTGYDVIFLAGIAVVVACICQGRLSNLMVLVAGRQLC